MKKTLLFITLLLSIGLTAQTTIYVNTNVSGGKNDGTSWANAYSNLQDALTNSSSGDQIWVAEGTYTPGNLETDSFNVPSNVTVLGGFNATETTANERNWATNPTILSGDLNNSLTENPGDSHTIVTMIGNNTEINGFFIQWGYADDGTDNSQPAIGRSGAGIYNNGNNKIFNCNIRSNVADTTDNPEIGIGAGLVSFGGTLEIANTLFYSNTASANGGAISAESGTINLTNCTITNNNANKGGGVHFYNGSINATNTIFTNNSGTNGNINNDGGAGTGTANYCLFYNATTDNNGNLPPNITGNNNIENTDPLYTNGYQLNYNSPAIEAGNNTAYTNTGGDLNNDLDLAGNPRLHVTSIDIGAYENQRLLLAPDSNNILYVDKNVSGGTADGSSWANAIPELADALTWAKENESNWTTANPLKIWVGEGTYKPTTTIDRTLSFELFGNLQLIGGFSPSNGSINLATRDFKTYPTVLSGDIGTLGDNTDNSYSVVLTNGHIPNLTVDGITIEQGYASGNTSLYFERCGGGWFHDAEGNGIVANITLKNAIIKNNTSLYYAGGGIATFTRNNAEVYWTIKNCIFKNNNTPDTERGYGSAYYSASINGHISETNISNSLFNDNHSSSLSTPYVGTIHFYNTGGSSINSIVNSTITNNTAASNTGNAVGLYYATVSIYNSILWNGGNEINSAGATAPIYNSLVAGVDNTANGGLDGTNTIITPGFTNQANNDFTLLDTSPVVDAGDNTAYTNAGGDLSNDLDLAGNPRLHVTSIDIGAYENQRLLLAPDTNNILYVDKNVSGGTADGSSWANAVPELADALTWAKENESNWTTANPLKIWVAEGTYKPTTTIDRTLSFELFGNLLLIGGFSPSNGSVDLASRDFKTYPTILSGDIGTLGDSTDNSYSVVLTNGHTPNLAVDGVTIEQGYADSYNGASPHSERYGGGWFHHATGNGIVANITLKNAIIKNNTSLYYSGGGMASYVEHNAEIYWTIENCIFKDNYTPDTDNGKGSAYISISLYGGTSKTNIINSLFYDNQAGTLSTTDAGTIYFVNNGGNSINSITNSTIANNTVASNTGNAIGLYNATVSIYNSILWNGGNEIRLYSGATAYIYNSLVAGVDNTANGGLDGTNTSITPGFTNQANNDFTLLDTSPVVDAGDNTAYTNAGGDLSNDLDLAGNPRLNSTTIDMGAYELDLTLSNNNLIQTDFTVYPNPVNNVLNIKTSVNNYNYQLYNLHGQKIIEANKQASNTINTSQLPSGVYILKLISNHKTQSVKVVKQ